MEAVIDALNLPHVQGPLRLLTQQEADGLGTCPTFDFSSLIHIIDALSSEAEVHALLDNASFRQLMQQSPVTIRAQFLTALTEDITSSVLANMRTNVISYVAGNNSQQDAEILTGTRSIDNNVEWVSRLVWIDLVRPLPFAFKYFFVHLILQEIIIYIDMHFLTDSVRFIRLFGTVVCRMLQEKMIMPVIQECTTWEAEKLLIGSLYAIPAWPDLASLPVSASNVSDFYEDEDTDRDYAAQFALVRTNWPMERMASFQKAWEEPLLRLVQRATRLSMTGLSFMHFSKIGQGPLFEINKWLMGAEFVDSKSIVDIRREKARNPVIEEDLEEDMVLEEDPVEEEELEEAQDPVVRDQVLEEDPAEEEDLEEAEEEDPMEEDDPEEDLEEEEEDGDLALAMALQAEDDNPEDEDDGTPVLTLSQQMEKMELNVTVLNLAPVYQIVTPLLVDGDVQRVGRCPTFDFVALIKLFESLEEQQECKDFLASQSIHRLVLNSSPIKRMQILVQLTKNMTMSLIVSVYTTVHVNNAGIDIHNTNKSYTNEQDSKWWTQRMWVEWTKSLPFLIKRFLVHVVFLEFLDWHPAMYSNISKSLTKPETDLTAAHYTRHVYDMMYFRMLIPLLKGCSASELAQLTANSLRSVPGWPDLGKLPGSAGQIHDVLKHEEGEDNLSYEGSNNYTRARWGLLAHEVDMMKIRDPYVRDLWNTNLHKLHPKRRQEDDLNKPAKKPKRTTVTQLMLTTNAEGQEPRTLLGEGTLEFAQGLATQTIRSWMGHEEECNMELGIQTPHENQRIFTCECTRISVTATLVPV